MILLPDGNCRNYIIVGTEVWETLTPWKATYWKTLPVGYRVRYQTKPVEIDEFAPAPQELIEEKRQAREWYRRLRKWYTNYFKESIE